MVAASIASLTAAVDRLSLPVSIRRATMAGVLTVCLAANAWSVRAAGLFPARSDLKAEAARYEHIGDVVGHSTHVASLDYSYGLALSYHGLLRASNLPLNIDLALERLAGRVPASAVDRLKQSGAEFLVATNQAELEAQGDLKALVDRQFPVLARDGTPARWNYVVYDLRHSRISLAPERVSVFALEASPRFSPRSISLWSADAVRWRVQPPRPDLFDIHPHEGTGRATLYVIARAVPDLVDSEFDVPVFREDAAEPAARFTVRFKTFATLPRTPPYGAMENAGQPIALGTQLLMFQGWALDDFDLRRVWAEYADATGRNVPAGDANQTWMRPDLAALKPDAHDIYNDGWILYVQPQALRGVPRPIVLRFYAENGDGQRAEIGARTIVDK
jgi:hypothetical protein